MLEGYVADSGGAIWPVWMVRAGDIVTIKNILPPGSSYDDDLEDRLVDLYVQETTYDASTGRLTIVPSESTTGLLDVILSLAGLSGGSLK
jgi:hypothetical protein